MISVSKHCVAVTSLAKSESSSQSPNISQPFYNPSPSINTGRFAALQIREIYAVSTHRLACHRTYRCLSLRPHTVRKLALILARIPPRKQTTQHHPDHFVNSHDTSQHQHSIARIRSTEGRTHTQRPVFEHVPKEIVLPDTLGNRIRSLPNPRGLALEALDSMHMSAWNDEHWVIGSTHVRLSIHGELYPSFHHFHMLIVQFVPVWRDVWHV